MMASATLRQRATPQLMKVINKRDKNTRALAKVVSAMEYLTESILEQDASCPRNSR